MDSPPSEELVDLPEKPTIKPGVKIKLVWVNRETQKKTHAPIDSKYWSNIPFFRSMAADIDLEPNQEYPIELLGSFYTDVVKLYIKWCCNVDLINGYHQQLAMLPSYELYNLIELCNYLQDETKLAIIPVGFPSNGKRTIEAIKNLSPIWQKKVFESYTTSCKAICKDAILKSPYHKLWYFLGYKPRVAEYFFAKKADVFFLDCGIPNRDKKQFLGKTYSQTINHLISYDDFVCDVYGNYRLYDLKISREKISPEMYQGSTARQDARRTLRELSDKYKISTSRLQTLRNAVGNTYSDGTEISVCLKDAQKDVEEYRKAYNNYAKHVVENKILPKSEAGCL